jgi:hypothetical protein
MQRLDPHTLFSIFENGDEEIYKEHGIEDTLNNPYVLIGMVVRGIENYQLMDLMYMRQYPKEYKNVRELTKYKYYTKLYSYLTRIDSSKFEDIYKVGESYESNSTEKGLNTLLKYFEGIEHYEKCAVIKRFYDLITSSIVKSYFNV